MGRDGRRQLLVDTAAAPAVTPRWFWKWARWRLGRGEYRQAGPAGHVRRPAAPPTIPAWAWRRLALIAGPAPAAARG
jgi:hypothetical protein